MAGTVDGARARRPRCAPETSLRSQKAVGASVLDRREWQEWAAPAVSVVRPRVRRLSRPLHALREIARFVHALLTEHP